MKCPKCGGNTIVIDKRWMPVMYTKSGYNMRRRECKECKLRIETEEVYRYPTNSGKREAAYMIIKIIGLFALTMMMFGIGYIIGHTEGRYK